MEDCIFCKIINGEIPSERVFENENVLAFLDINPKAKVHVLVVPKKHIESVKNLEENDKELVGELFLASNSGQTSLAYISLTEVSNFIVYSLSNSILFISGLFARSSNVSWSISAEIPLIIFNSRLSLPLP